VFCILGSHKSFLYFVFYILKRLFNIFCISNIVSICFVFEILKQSLIKIFDNNSTFKKNFWYLYYNYSNYYITLITTIILAIITMCIVLSTNIEYSCSYK